MYVCMFLLLQWIFSSVSRLPVFTAKTHGHHPPTPPLYSVSQSCTISPAHALFSTHTRMRFTVVTHDICTANMHNVVLHTHTGLVRVASLQADRHLSQEVPRDIASKHLRLLTHELIAGLCQPIMCRGCSQCNKNTSVCPLLW